MMQIKYDDGMYFDETIPSMIMQIDSLKRKQSDSVVGSMNKNENICDEKETSSIGEEGNPEANEREWGPCRSQGLMKGGQTKTAQLVKHEPSPTLGTIENYNYSFLGTLNNNGKLLYNPAGVIRS